jgi:NitT/TauT family transport system substrate-binding protein
MMVVAIYVASTLAITSAIAAETTEFHIARQPGIVYLQPVLMEENKLVEKHAAALGLNDLKVRWSIITSGGVMTEALISGSIDMAVTGLSNMLLLWDKTKGGVKTVAGVAGTSFLLLTRNPTCIVSGLSRRSRRAGRIIPFPPFTTGREAERV